MNRKQLQLSIYMSFFALSGASTWAGAAEPAHGQVPAQVAQQLGAAGLPQSAVNAEGLVWLNKTIYTVKTVDKTTGLPAAWTWDENGVLLADRGAALRKQEAVARRQCDGAMTDSLWTAIAPLPARRVIRDPKSEPISTTGAKPLLPSRNLEHMYSRNGLWIVIL